MSYYIGMDLGTSALKLLLVDGNGKIVNSVTNSYDVHYPAPGWSEQYPYDWWNALTTGIKELIKGVNPDEIKGISAAGQMHGLVILDENDNVIRPTILWNDGRTAEETEYLNTVVGKERLAELTANIAFAGFTAPKILWLKKNEKENFDKIAKIMLPKDYLNYRLTGVHSCDYSDASGMLLLDVKNKRWSKEMIEICGISEVQLPKLYNSFEKIGTLTPEIAKELGLNENTVVAAGGGDNAVAAIGTKTVGEGMCNISLGTSGTIFVSSDNFSVDPCNALHAFCHSDGGYHHDGERGVFVAHDAVKGIVRCPQRFLGGRIGIIIHHKNRHGECGDVSRHLRLALAVAGITEIHVIHRKATREDGLIAITGT